MKSRFFTLLLGLGMISFLGCTKYPPDSERLLQDLAVLTQYDVACNFKQYQTYMITDSVTLITDKDSSKVVNSNTKLVVNAIVANMNARGYKQVTKNADLAFNVAYFENVHVSVYSPGWYWGGYYPPSWYGYPGYSYYYPYYPTYYTSYTSGTLAWDMVDLKNAQASGKLYIRWNAFIRGLLTGSHTTSDITNSINTAFTQTPQISTSGK